MKGLIFSFLLLFIRIPLSHACSCLDPGTVEEAYQNTSNIIRATVLTKNLITLEGTMDRKKALEIRMHYKDKQSILEQLDSILILQIHLRVNRIYKGQVRQDTVIVYTTSTSASCGYTEFETGREYLIYASSKSFIYEVLFNLKLNERLERNNTFWTHRCTLTKPYDRVEENMLIKLSGKWLIPPNSLSSPQCISSLP